MSLDQKVNIRVLIHLAHENENSFHYSPSISEKGYKYLCDSYTYITQIKSVYPKQTQEYSKKSSSELLFCILFCRSLNCLESLQYVKRKVSRQILDMESDWKVGA